MLSNNKIRRRKIPFNIAKRYLRIIENANDGMWEWNIDLNVIWFSKRFKSLLGYNDSQLQKGNFEQWYQLVYPADAFRAHEFIHNSLNSIAIDPVTLRFCHCHSGIRYMQCRITAERDIHGRVISLIGAQTDITDVTAAMQELRDARIRAESASRSKSDFLANMSHEIRTPLNAILGMIDLLQESPLSPEQKEWLKTAHYSSESLLALLSDILDISKIEAGKFTLESQPFSVVDVTKEVHNILHLKAKKKKLAFNIEYSPDVMVSVMGDPMRLRQILLNLVRNAINFTSQGYVRTVIQCESKNETHISLCFCIEDSGIGIAPEKLQYIFQKFSQADESTTRLYGGTGLGLSISKALADHMGGTITVTSKPGKGSSFMLRLQLSIANRVHITEQPLLHNSKIPSEISVLIAEDILPNQLYMKAVLKKNHCQCDIANNGLEAVKMNHAKKYDLIFMDLHMPVMDGYEATRIIRQQSPGPLPVVVALTADVSQGERERCLKVGMDEYLAKPVKSSKITEILRRVCDRRLDH